MEVYYYLLYIIIFAIIVFLLEKGEVLPFTHRKFFVYLWYEVYSVFNFLKDRDFVTKSWSLPAQNFLGVIGVLLGYLPIMLLIDNFTKVPFKLLDYLFFTIFGLYVFLIWSFCLVIDGGGFDEAE